MGDSLQHSDKPMAPLRAYKVKWDLEQVFFANPHAENPSFQCINSCWDAFQYTQVLEQIGMHPQITNYSGVLDAYPYPGT